MPVVLVETRELKANRKIPVPEGVHEILALDWSENLVCWNVHAETGVIILSSEPLSGENHSEYEFVDYTELLDNRRYIRPPDEVFNRLEPYLDSEYTYDGASFHELIVDIVEGQAKDILSQVDDIMLGSSDRNVFVFMAYDQDIVERPRKVILLRDQEFRARMPHRSEEMLMRVMDSEDDSSE